MISVSWSTINNYMICGLKVGHELEGTLHSIGWPLAAGNAGHVGLAAWANGDDPQEAFLARWEEYARGTATDKGWNGQMTGKEQAVILKAQILDLLGKYTTALKDRVPNPKNVEVSLTKDLGDGVFLTGRVDCVAWEGKVIDWKFASSIKYLDPLQALLYAVLTGGPCEFEYHALVKARSPFWKAIPVPETEKQENLDLAVERVVKPIARAIEAGIFPASPSAYLCDERYCGYWESCSGHYV